MSSRRQRNLKAKKAARAAAIWEQSILESLNWVHVQCGECGYEFDATSPALSIRVPPGASLTARSTGECPSCGHFIAIPHFHATAADGSTISAMTPALLTRFLEQIRDELEQGSLTPEAAIERLERSPLRPVGAWLRRHAVELGAIAAIAAVLGFAIDIVQSVLELAPDPSAPMIEQYDMVNREILERLERRDEEFLDKLEQIVDKTNAPIDDEEPRPTTP